MLVPAVLAVVVAGTLVSAALTPKDMSGGEAAVEVSSDANLAAFDVSRLLTAGVLGAAAFTIAVVAAGAGMPRSGLALWLAYLAFTLTNYVLPAFAGQARGIEPRLLYSMVVFSAVYFARPLSAAGVATACKVAFGAFLYASLVAAALVPAQVVAADYEGLLPSVTFRLYGLGGGATSLGTQAAGYLAVEAVAPSRSWTRYLHGGVALVVLVLTQSKTSWIFVVAGGVLLLLWSPGTLRGTPAGDAAPPRPRPRWALVAVALGGLGGTAMVVVGALAGASPGADNLKTLTGRGYIWATTIDVWLANPVFGYGVGLWLDEDFRATYGGFAHAHNQFLHALGSAGVVGFLGLLAYLGTAWVLARRASATNPVPLVLLALLLVQCLADVPLRHLQVLDAWTVVHLLTFVAIRQVADVGGGPRRGLAHSTLT